MLEEAIEDGWDEVRVDCHEAVYYGVANPVEA